MRYSVWVDGSEVNDYYLTLEDAQVLYVQFIEDGYDGVSIEVTA